MEARRGGGKAVPDFCLFGQSAFTEYCLVPVAATSREIPPSVVRVQIKLHDRGSLRNTDGEHPPPGLSQTGKA